MEECVIIGGGIASLSAANRLAERSINPLIIEAGEFPSHRVCGEFLSHECLPILKRWDIPISNFIDGCQWVCGSKKLEFSLPRTSGTTSRYILDNELVKRAKSQGVRLLTQTQVVNINYGSHYELLLSNGKTVHAKTLMMGTGKIPGGSIKPLTLKYTGFKAHFEGLNLEKGLEMHCFEGGYLGISSIGNQTYNVACIVSKKKDPEKFIKSLCESARLRNKLKNGRMIFPKWMITDVPEFGLRKNPDWKNVFWIGDAAGSIPPISGEGLAMAVTSGYMAADYFIESNAESFKRDWIKRYGRRFFWAKQLHNIMINPFFSPMAISLGKIPGLPRMIWNLTREVP